MTKLEKDITKRFLDEMNSLIGPGAMFKSKRAFALKIKERQQTITKLEKGLVVAQYRHLKVIHELTGATMDWLILGIKSKEVKRFSIEQLEQRLSKLENRSPNRSRK